MFLYRMSIAITAFAFGGCATVVHGTHQTIEITSSPPNAQVTITPGQTVATTPVRVSLERGRGYEVRFEKDGHRTRKAYLDSHTSGAIWGNVMIPIGLMIDLANGAGFELRPANLHINLAPVTQDASEER